MTHLQSIGCLTTLLPHEVQCLASVVNYVVASGDLHSTYPEGSFALSNVQLGLLHDILRLAIQFKHWVKVQNENIGVRSEYLKNEDALRQCIADVLVESGFGVRDSCRAALECQFPLSYTRFNFTSLAVVHIRLFSGLELSTNVLQLLTERINECANSLQFVELPPGVSTCFPAICFHLQALHQVCTSAGMTYLVHPTVMNSQTISSYYSIFYSEPLLLQ